MTSFNLNYLLKSQSSNAITMAVRASAYEFCGNAVQSTAESFRETVFQDKPKLYKVKDMEVTFVGKIKVIFSPWHSR